MILSLCEQIKGGGNSVNTAKNKMTTKSQVLAELKANPTTGIGYGQGGGSSIAVTTYREFLDWYSDAGHDRYSIEEKENDSYDEDADTWETVIVYELVRRSSIDNRIWDCTEFSTFEDANDEYYNALEHKYRDDNGAGGVWYSASEAIDEIEAGEYDKIFLK